ncbi:MAG: Isoleucine--tRNA ligase [Chlamydiia bacterium]|nr:Isoleucine--tRNA ligase [Chlamydiia bacterium]
MFKTEQEKFSEREVRILKLWNENNFFEKSVEQREGSPSFTFYDGPPFATGLPHYGHLLAGTLKDIIPRYKTMKGFHVPRRFGWDCHGVPVENEIEKRKNLSGAPSIEEFGVANFNEECRSIVQRFVSEWKDTVLRMGRWVDFDNSYKTMDPDYMESVWWVIGQLWDKGLIYEGFKVMPVSAKLGTPLSNFEANLNYKDVDDPSLTVKFKLLDEENTHLLVWTTTPWTLPSNLATIVHPEIEYVKIKDTNTQENYILAKSRLGAFYKEESEYEILGSLKGKDLEHKKYEPLFNYFVEGASENSFKVLVDEFVGQDDGTGIVHAAPAFGEMDFFVCKRENIELVSPVDQNCQFTKEIPEYKGMFVKDADKDIIKRLKADGKIFLHTQVRHRYPFCYRSDTPLIYKTVTTWFVAVEKVKEKILKANDQIKWVPGHIKTGRFGKWLENARDWAISRNRYWGTPIPIWRSEDNDFIVIRGKEDLESRTGKKIDDLHRHFIDDLTFEVDGKTYKRVPEVLDCWFETGSMPYAGLHYPFENQDKFPDKFPADFIAEGLDQTRGWFYTLTVLAAALHDKPAFKNAIVNGIILAEDGQKMSKRLKNYPDPNVVMDKYGADAIRLYLLHSPVVQADDLKFSEKGVEQTMRRFLIPLWNSYFFLATYANIYKWEPESFKKPAASIDRWILSKTQKLIHDVETALDDYEMIKAVDPFVEFIEQLTNWYIRRSRQRFWSNERTPDRDEAFMTLHRVLSDLIKVAAPFVPFISDAIYQELRVDGEKESVHLCDYPQVDSLLRDEVLEYEMTLVQQAVSMGHNLRKESKVKVRQPLLCAKIIASDEKVLKALEKQKHLIEEELNVKGVELCSDEGSIVTLKATPNFRVLGKKVGKLMAPLKKLIEGFDQSMLKELDSKGSLTVEVGGESITLTSEDIQIKKETTGDLVALSCNEFTITLDVNLTDALRLEGFARELVNKINTIRKSEGFEITDRVHIKIETTSKVQKSYEEHKDYICHEVLASSVSFDSCQGSDWDLNGEPAKIAISKA